MIKIFKTLALLTVIIGVAVYLYDRYLGGCDCSEEKCC